MLNACEYVRVVETVQGSLSVPLICVAHGMRSTYVATKSDISVRFAYVVGNRNQRIMTHSSSCPYSNHYSYRIRKWVSVILQEQIDLEFRSALTYHLILLRTHRMRSCLSRLQQCQAHAGNVSPLCGRSRGNPRQPLVTPACHSPRTHPLCCSQCHHDLYHSTCKNSDLIISLQTSLTSCSQPSSPLQSSTKR